MGQFLSERRGGTLSADLSLSLAFIVFPWPEWPPEELTLPHFYSFSGVKKWMGCQRFGACMVPSTGSESEHMVLCPRDTGNLERKR